jgi:hypothetical protein
MATMIAEVYDALLAAGAPEEKARAAASAIAGYENRFASLENRMVGLEGKLNMVPWMVATNVAFTAALLVKSFAF